MSAYRSLIIIIALAATAVLGLYQLVIHVANDNYNRELNYWESRLNITADIRVQRVSEWLIDFQNSVADIAANESVKLDMTMLPEATDDFVDAKGDYLYNYLTVMATQGLFLDTKTTSGISANIPVERTEGVALIAQDGTILSSTRGFPGVDATVSNQLVQGTAALIPYTADAGWQRVAAVVPIQAIHGDNAVGFVVAYKDVDNQLLEALNSPKMTEKTVETYLVRRHEGVLEYVTALQHEVLPVTRDDTSNRQLDAAIAFTDLGLQQGINYNTENTLSLARQIPELPQWRLIHSITSQEALATATAQRNQFILSGVLGLSALILIFFGLWRHGSSVRYKKLAHDFIEQKKLLRLIMDHQPDAMFILNANSEFCFSNLHLPIYDDIREDDMLGKAAKDVLGAAYAKPYIDNVSYALERQQVMSTVRQVTRNNTSLTIQSKYIPLTSVPELLGKQLQHAVLVVEQDITATVKANERQRKNLQEIVKVLASIVDDRDHHYADHSQRVAYSARDTAEAMGLDHADVEAVYIAGMLLNFGRVMLPRELFTKEGKLTAAERKMLTEAYRTSAEYLADIQFDGPVQDTILQSQERVDGAGPLGINNNQLLMTAKILRVCNDYIAMVSPRSYRDAMDSQQAADILMKDIDSCYDRTAVISLLHCLQQKENDDK